MFGFHCLIPVPFFRKYKQAPVKEHIKNTIMLREKEMDTSLTPSMPSLKVLTTYSIGFAIEIDLHMSGSIFME
jgi:hypothetical protein